MRACCRSPRRGFEHHAGRSQFSSTALAWTTRRFHPTPTVTLDRAIRRRAAPGVLTSGDDAPRAPRVLLRRRTTASDVATDSYRLAYGSPAVVDLSAVIRFWCRAGRSRSAAALAGRTLVSPRMPGGVSRRDERDPVDRGIPELPDLFRRRIRHAASPGCVARGCRVKILAQARRPCVCLGGDMLQLRHHAGLAPRPRRSCRLLGTEMTSVQPRLPRRWCGGRRG